MPEEKITPPLELDLELLRTAETLSRYCPGIRYIFFEDNCKMWPKYKMVIKAMAAYCAEIATQTGITAEGRFLIEMQAYFKLNEE